MSKILAPKQITAFLGRASFLGGKTVVIGGSSLFHGAPILSLTAASRFNQTVFFTSPEGQLSRVAAQVKGRLASFIWFPFDQVDDYLVDSDCSLIGPGMMRYSYQNKAKKYCRSFDRFAGRKTKMITERLLKKFSYNHWVIDAGSLQVIDKEAIPPGAVLTPNNQEFEVLFGDKLSDLSLSNQIKVVCRRAKENNCLILTKNFSSVVASGDDYLVVSGGNKGLEKGGSGDTLAGLIMALLAKAESPLVASAVALWLFKTAAEKLTSSQGLFYNADDLAKEIASLAGRLARV